EIVLDLGGSKVRVTDTAGIRPGAGKVEAIGIERAMARASSADLLLYLVDASQPVLLDSTLPPVQTLRIGTKIDLLSGAHASNVNATWLFLRPLPAGSTHCCCG